MFLNCRRGKFCEQKCGREVWKGSVSGQRREAGRTANVAVACCFRRFWLCGKLNASVVWLTDDKDWSGLAGGSNGSPSLPPTPLPPTPEQTNTCYARERKLSLDNLGEASLLLLGMFTVLQACRQQLLLQSRMLLVLLVAGLFTMSTRGEGNEGAVVARVSSACVATS